ncbi:Dis3, partial [Symbiodinium sp. KB8]
RGRVVKLVKEHYLRDDIRAGTDLIDIDQYDEAPLSDTPFRSQYLLLDIDVTFSQLDLLEYDCDAFRDVIICQTALEAVRRKNLALFNRMHSLLRDDGRRFHLFSNEHHRNTYVERREGEAADERDRRAVRTAAGWYTQRLKGKPVTLLFLTGSTSEKAKAAEEGITALTVHEYVKDVIEQFPGLIEFLAGSELTEAEDGLQQGILVQGTLRTSRHCWWEARVAVYGPNKEGISVLVRGRDAINRAMEGDVVALRIAPRSKWKRSLDAEEGVAGGEEGPQAAEEMVKQPSASELEGETLVIGAGEDEDARALMDVAQRDGGEEGKEEGKEEGAVHRSELLGELSKADTEGLQPVGSVVGIIKRNWRQYCGSLLVGEDEAVVGTRAIVVPVDTRIPRIRIATRQKEDLLDKRILVAIDGWERTSPYPHGHYVRTLGQIGDKEVETQVLLLEHDIPTRAFSKAVMACLPPADWVVTAENSEGRRDLRDLNVVSVDPPGCKDIDDALHARPLPNGNWELGVHIADVTHFVKAGTPIDLEAASRGNTTYLVERRLDMLPGLLTTTLCSLKPHVDRFAFSVVWEVTPPPSVEVVKVDFCKSIIHSKRAFTYEEAQSLIDDANAKDEIAASLRRLLSVSRVLRQRRKEAGSLTLASPEVRFLLDSETHDPLDVKAYVLRETNSMVEEFMLLANITVAQKVTDTFPRFSLLRRHPAPSRRAFDSLVAAAESVGVHLNVNSSKELADSLDKADVEGNPYFNRLIRILTTRCMMQAVYFPSGELTPSEYFHYGLATPIYTHFTSPIRRYADVVVHRLLAAAMRIDALPASYEDRTGMRSLCDNLNRRHLASQLAGRASVALHSQIFFQGRLVVEQGLIMRLRANGVIVLIPRFGLEALVNLPAAKGAKKATDYTYDEKEHKLVHTKDKSLNLKMFQQVQVAVYVKDLGQHRRKVAYRLVEPAVHKLPRLPGKVRMEVPEGKVFEMDEELDGPKSALQRRQQKILAKATDSKEENTADDLSQGSDKKDNNGSSEAAADEEKASASASATPT